MCNSVNRLLRTDSQPSLDVSVVIALSQDKWLDGIRGKDKSTDLCFPEAVPAVGVEGTKALVSSKLHWALFC
jgi:hypothetical protein